MTAAKTKENSTPSVNSDDQINLFILFDKKIPLFAYIIAKRDIINNFEFNELILILANFYLSDVNIIYSQPKLSHNIKGVSGPSKKIGLFIFWVYVICLTLVLDVN